MLTAATALAHTAHTAHPALPIPESVLPTNLDSSLRCPGCRSPLVRTHRSLRCQACVGDYPLMGNIPILIDETKSVFRIEECLATSRKPRPKTWRDLARDTAYQFVPNAARNLSGKSNFGLMASRLRAENPRARVLVVGGQKLGCGLENLLSEPSFEVVETDVVLGHRTRLVCDAHDLPFADGTFDAAILQGVLEYMTNPFRVADEIHRVLRKGGYVYAESPFMQPVHGGGHDFFRFTDRGQRRLFNHFEEVKSGVACGPGMALSSSYRYFLRSFVNTPIGRTLTDAVGKLTSFWLTRLDNDLANNAGAFDAASAFYFLGRRSDRIVPDREIIEHYKGTWKMH